MNIRRVALDAKKSLFAKAKKFLDENKEKCRSIIFYLFLPLSLLYMEFTAKAFIFGFGFEKSNIYIMLFSLSIGAFFSFIFSLFGGKARKAAVYTLLSIWVLLISFHVGYYKNFKEFFSLAQLRVAGNAISDFSGLILFAAAKIWYIVILLLLPILLFFLLQKKLVPDKSESKISSLISILSTGVIFLFALVLILGTGNVYGSDGYTYKYPTSEIESTIKSFGIMQTSILDFKQEIFGAAEVELTLPTSGGLPGYVSYSDNNDNYGYNVLDIDFEKLANEESDKTISQMHQYVASMPATQKNSYTGYFKDKNLIFMTMEAFSYKVIDPEFTPTLYMMSTGGFVFNNYYHSMWGGSTATGEYTNLTGQVYNSSTCLELSSTTYQPNTLANNLKKQGYCCYAYHDHTEFYYKRNSSHPNFGYVYKAKGSGLNVTDVWPESDLEMAQLSMDDYINQKPFHAYYTTVSGHYPYSINNNNMSYTHFKELPEKYKSCSSEIKSYLACQYEVELMLQYMINRLEEAGVLDDTVFVLVPDHYPYGMSDKELSTFYGLSRRNLVYNFELYKNSFIIWNSAMKEPVTVDKYCSGVDVLPTVLNLWGLDYESRFFMGSDIFSETEGIAIIKQRYFFWKTDKGTFGNGMKFTPSPDCDLSDEEIEEYCSRINNMLISKNEFSKKVLDKDYFRYVFKPDN